MSEAQSAADMLSLDTLPDSLIISVGDFCDLGGMEALSRSSRKLNGLMRIRPLDAPREGFSVLKREANAIVRRMESMHNQPPKSSTEGINNTHNSHLDWGLKVTGAFLARYAKDPRIVSAEEDVRRQNVGGKDSKHWRLRVLDTVICDSLVLNEPCSYYLYYLDDRDGPNWQRWWLTSHYIGFTRYRAFSRGSFDTQHPYECPHWHPPSFRVVKEVHGTGVFVRDLRHNSSTVSHEGLYREVASTHCVGNRRVYRLARKLTSTDKWLIDSHLAAEASLGLV